MTKTHTMRSRLISLVLVLVMVLGCLPLSALAADPELVSTFTDSGTKTYGDFHVSASVTDGYKLQTVGTQDSTQDVGMTLRLYMSKGDASISNGSLRIDFYGEDGVAFRRIVLSQINYGSSAFSGTPTAASYSFDDNGDPVKDETGWQPKVRINPSGNGAILVEGIHVTLTGAGGFPLKASITGNSAASADIQVLGTFDIKGYSADVPTVNLTFDLDATDAYYAYSTVAIPAGEEYILPTVNPIREHYEFTGWKYEDDIVVGTPIPANKTIGNLRIIAQWELDTVNVTYPVADALPTGVTYGNTAPTGDDVDYGSVQSFDLVLDEGYDPATLFVTANNVLLAPVNYVLGADGEVTYTYSFTATDDTTIAVSDDLAKLSYVVTMPVGHFTAKLTGNGITSEASTTVEYGGSYSFTVDPEDGYKIMGVYVNGDKLTAGGTGNNEYTVITVTGSQVVEVVVEEIPNYTVTYVVNDKQYTTQVVADGEKVAALPEAPVVTGYTFDGWYTEQNGVGTEFTAATAVTGNITVYAKLTAETYTITYSANGDNVTGMPASGTTKTYGQPVQLDTAMPSRDGYTFLGWSRNENATEATYAAGDYFTEEITGTVPLYAVWKANTYTVTLPTGTGYTIVAHSETVVNWGDDFTFFVYVDRGYVENTPEVSVNGVKLNGTDRGTNASDTKTYEYKIEDIKENQVVNVTVAKNKTYTVDFQVQGASYLTQEVEYGYCATVPAAPVVEGYTFRGWTTDEANEYPYDFTTPVTEDLTLYAHLEKITYTVKLPTDADGYDVNPNGDQTVAWNGSQVFTVTVEEGYSDANMVVSANGTPLYPIGKTDSTYTYKIFNIKADQEVYVVGVERKTVTITYNDNGGVGGPTQQVANYYVATASDNSEVSAIEPTRDGYVFQGWAKTNTATANDVVYKHGVDDKDTLQETTDITLYAVWAKAEAAITIATDVEEQYEGKDIVLTATVTADDEAMTSGSVEFFRVTEDEEGTEQLTSLGTAPVNGGKATMTVQASAWSEGAVDAFSAKFIPAEGFGYAGASTTDNATVTIKSTAITWGVAEGVVQSELKITGTLDAEDNMIAGQTYELTIPAVYALDDADNAVTNYTVTWEKKTAGGDWAQIANADGDTYVVTAYEAGDQYRAKLTPTDPYNKAANDPIHVSYTATLVTGETEEAVKQATEIALTVTDTHDCTTGDDGTNVVAEFEGQDVTLTASVTYGQDAAVTEGYVQFYLNGEKIGEPVAVNAESGKAVLTWTTSAYNKGGANTDSYTAKYLGTASYQGSTTEVNGKTVLVRSTAIAWPTDNGNELRNLIVKENGTEYDGNLIAGHTYTLTIPTVVELGQSSIELSVNEDYVVSWYVIYADKTEGTLVTSLISENSVTVKPETDGVFYYAVITAKGDYTKAYTKIPMNQYEFGYNQFLTTVVNNRSDATTTEIELTIDGAVAMNNSWEQYEGRTITLNAKVNVEGSTTTMVEHGNVSFYVITKQEGQDEVTATSELIGGQAVAVENGLASVTYELPEYLLNEGLKNIEYFYAVYEDVSTELSGEVRYAPSTTATVNGLDEDITTGNIPVENQLQVRSVAITWQLTTNSEGKQVIADGANAITIYNYDAEADGYKGSKLGDKEVMDADKSYVLEMPAAYAYDAVTGTTEPLAIGTDYTVQWQYYVKDTESWMDYKGKDAYSDSIVITPEYHDYGFRVQVTPKYDNDSLTGFRKAAKYDGAEVIALNFQVLYSDTTVPTDRKGTATDLTITGADNESKSVMINGNDETFTADHYARFEGQTVTLKTTVTEADAADVMIPTGYVYFYRYEGNGQTVLLNATPVEVKDGIAELEVTITSYDGEKGVTENADKFFAVYEPNDTYDGSASTTTNAEGAYEQPAETDWVYIKSTSIKTPIVESALPGKIDDAEAYATTYADDLIELKAGVAHTFTLRQEADMAEQDYSVVALDGRYVEDSNYTIQWLVKNGDNEETTAAENVNPYVTTTTKSGDKYRLWLEPEGDMTVGAYSKYLIVGTKQLVNVTVVASDEIDATKETDVYQLNDITLTATVVGAEEGNSMKPTGKVTFYYSVDEGTTWVKIDEAALAQDAVTGDMVATLVTNVLPVDATNYTKEDVTVTAIYEGDETFLVSATFNEGTKEITDTEDSITEDDDVTVYSSVVKRSPMENKPNTPTTAPDGKEGLMAYVDGNLMVNEENVTLMLSDLYTLDGADETTIEAISKLTHGTDYTIIWQELTNYESYKNADLNDAPWTNLNDSDTHQYNVNVKQGAAYRAMITVKDTAPVKGSFTEVLQADADDATSGSKIYYTNILVPTLGQSTLSYNITTDKFTNFNEEGIVEGEKATVHVYINGATETTPISSLTVSITKQGETGPVYTDTRYSVNGYTAIDWQTKVGDAGYYELKIEAVPSNGYEPETLTRTIIVRDDSYTFNVSNLNPTYNGKTQGVSIAVEGMDIEAALAAKSWTVTYTDAEGNKAEPTQAGTYTYIATLPASAYWTEKTVEGTFTIEKRQVSVVDLVAQAKVYDGATNVNLLEIVLGDAETAQSTTGLPTNNWGVINGDSLYAVGTGYTASANAGNTKLGVKDVELKGDDAHNYVLNSTSYTEDFNIQRNQLQGDVADATYKYTGSSITVPADDVYLIDQQGNVVTDYTITYYYHNGEGVEKVEAMKDLGMYTIVVNKDPANYKGGASQTVYVSDTAVEAVPSKDYHSATVDITNTVELYGEFSGIVTTASTGTVSKIEYRVGTEWTTTVPTNAGRYLVKVTTSTDDVAYGIYTIVKVRPEVTLTVGETTVVYDSALHTGNPTTTSSGEGAVYYTYSGDVVIGEHGSDSKVNVDFQGQHDVGTYVVTAHVAETTNYTAHEVSKTFEITPKALTISANDKQRHLYSAYPDMLATYEGLATGGVAVDTSRRDIQIMPEFHYDDHENDSESHVGYYTVTPVSALAKNYTVTYVDGEFSVNENDPRPTLAIVGAPQNGKGDGKTYAYYGDVIQLYAYGNQKDGVINKSSVLTWQVVSGNATIDETGKLTINGTGNIVVKLTRGTGRTAISTELTITALKKEVQVIVPDQDVVYNGTSQTYSGTMTAVDEKYNAVDAAITAANTDRTEIGSQIVDGDVAETAANYQSETYGGKFTINDKEINIEPIGKDTVYGTKVEGLTYREVTPVGNVAALTDGFAVSVADAYDNLDVLDGYEILVAGRENINYNVKYVTDQTAEDVQVTEKALTIKTGSYADTVGKTGDSLNPAGDYPVNGAIVDPTALFETDGMRMYGEPNQVMGFVLETPIAGDSVADVNALLDWLVEFDIDDHHLINEDANITYPTKDTTKEHVVELDGTARNYDLHIGTEMDYHNYHVTVQEGTQNIYQRPVTLTTRNGITLSAFRDSILSGSNPDEDAILEILLNNLVVGKYNGEGGLATLLNHTIEDLDIRIVSAVYTPSSDPDSTSAGTIKVTIKLGNVNYWTEDLVFDIDVTKVNIKPVYGPLGRTSSYVTMTKDGAPYDVDGKVFYLIYKKAAGDDGSWIYADYRNLTPVVNVEMVKNPYITGRYTATYDALPNGDYVMFAIAENYTIV